MTCFLRALIGATAFFCLAGCVAPGDRLEFTWQALHAVDTVQTMRGVADGCQELNPFLGRDPLPTKVLAVSGFFALAHGFLTEWLENTGASATTMWIWQGASIAAESFAVVHNAQQRCR